MTRGFVQLSKAYYGANLLRDFQIKDEVTFGFFSPEGGTTGEMTVAWKSLCGKIVPELTIFSDAWSALSNFHDLIDLLGQHDNEDPSPGKFCKYLLQCGFVDMTQTTEPSRKIITIK
jgi:hypothetical protein